MKTLCTIALLLTLTAPAHAGAPPRTRTAFVPPIVRVTAEYDSSYVYIHCDLYADWQCVTSPDYYPFCDTWFAAVYCSDQRTFFTAASDDSSCIQCRGTYQPSTFTTGPNALDITITRVAGVTVWPKLYLQTRDEYFEHGEDLFTTITPVGTTAAKSVTWGELKARWKPGAVR